MIRKKKILITIFILYFKFYSHSKNINPITLKQAIKTTLINNSELKIAKYKEHIESNNYILNITKLLPNVRLSLMESNIRKNLFGQKNDPISRNKTNYVSGSISWDIMGIIKQFPMLAIAKKNKNLQSIQTNIDIENKIEDTSKKYFKLVLEEYKYKVLKKNLELAQERLNIVEKSYLLGKISKLKFLEHKVSYNKILSNILKQEEQVTMSQYDLNNAIGQPSNTNLQATDPIKLGDILVWDDVLNNFQIYNQAVKYQRINVKKYKILKAATTYNLLPEITLGIQYNVFKYDLKNSFKKIDGSLELIAKIELNLINVFESLNNKLNTNIQYKIAHLNKELTNRNLISNLKLIYLNYKHNLRRYELEKKNYEVAKENAKMALVKFNNGTYVSYQLHQAIQNEKEANFALILALYNAKLAEITINKLTGKLLEKYI